MNLMGILIIILTIIFAVMIFYFAPKITDISDISE